MQRKKLTGRQAQAIKTRNKIYNIAFDLMEKKGFGNITIEEISRKAGVSVGAFYHYFRSKNDILVEIYHRADEYFEENVANKLESDRATDRIVEYFIHYARYSSRTGIEFSKHLYNTDNKFFIQKDRFMLKVLEDILTDGQGSGEIRTDMDASEIADELFIFVRGIMFDWCLYDGAYDLESRMASAVRRLAPVYAA